MSLLVKQHKSGFLVIVTLAFFIGGCANTTKTGVDKNLNAFGKLRGRI